MDTIRFAASGYTDTVIAFGYNVAGERVYKHYIRQYKDTCYAGGPRRPLGPGGPGGGGDTLCDYRDSTFTNYVRSKGRVLAEYDGGFFSVLKYKYIYAGNQRIAMYDQSGKLYFYLNDHLGSARVVVDDSTGSISDKYNYYAFGGNLSTTTATNQPRRYTGKPFDDENSIDLYYYGARYYDPDIGRFLAIDPLASKYPGWSPYLYTANNPLRRVDDNGREFYDKIAVPVKITVTKEMHQQLQEMTNLTSDQLPNIGSQIVAPKPAWAVRWQTPTHHLSKLVPLIGIAPEMAEGMSTLEGLASTGSDAATVAGPSFPVKSMIRQFSRIAFVVDIALLANNLWNNTDDQSVIDKFEELYGSNAVFDSRRVAEEAVARARREAKSPEPEPTNQ